jgi:hypothetical protein
MLALLLFIYLLFKYKKVLAYKKESVIFVW